MDLREYGSYYRIINIEKRRIMNHSKIFLISAIILMGLSSCVNEEVPAYENGSGKMQLEVDVLKPKSTRATVDTKDFYSRFKVKYEKAGVILPEYKI